MTTVPPEHHAYTDPKPGTYQSQHGEDKWIDIYFHKKQRGFFVEVGAYDGIVLSNSYHFEKKRGWTGILVEPDPQKAQHCRKNRPNSLTYECAAVGSSDVKEISFFQVAGGEVYSTANLTQDHRQRLDQYGLKYREVRVPAMTLDQILMGVKPLSVDFVSIDVEEGEFEVLKGFDIRLWKPKIVMIESNSSVRKPEIRDYFVRNGYAYFYSIAVNDFYRPVLGGALVASLIDHFRYDHMPRIRKFLDRHLLWRFKS